MRFPGCKNLVFAFMVFCAVLAWAQAAPDGDYQARRQKAAELFNQGKRLEALPLVEELVKANPKDDEMLVMLGACLIDHAATLTDTQAAGRERLRARDVLEQARKLGNTSPLAENLAELLNKMPESGAITFSTNPQVEQAMEAGEAAFSRRDFAEAIKNYGKALEIEPKNYSAVLFTANSYDKANQFTQAADWYQRAIALDANTETAYRYFADMVAREGDMKQARALLIEAAVAEPYNRIVWRELHAWAMLNNTKINQIYVGVPAPQKPGAAPVDSESTEIARAWDAYHSIRENWKQTEFKKHFPTESAYRHSLSEEYEALTAVARVLEKIKTDKKIASFNDSSANLLLRLHESGFMEPYILFSLGDNGIARDYTGYRARNRAKLKAYMEAFVVPGK